MKPNIRTNRRHHGGKQHTQTIEVTVSPTGAITVEAEGYSGSSCEEATRFLEEALGLPGKRVRKGEFYRRETRNSNQQQLGGTA
ncbi:MAG TPA: DUF2997 domain-containing protein [Pirellulaceae bacterium]